MAEARLEDSGSGLAPRKRRLVRRERAGRRVVDLRVVRLEVLLRKRVPASVNTPKVEFSQLGISLTVLEPGQPNGLYQGEDRQEGFLVLFGECFLLVEGEERQLRAWDFVHCPPQTEHIFVSAGDGPCVILMVGARSEDLRGHYPVSELAAHYGASVEEETSDPKQAYARFGLLRHEKPSYWERLPWA